jgi:hypothetical protein
MASPNQKKKIASPDAGSLPPSEAAPAPSPYDAALDATEGPAPAIVEPVPASALTKDDFVIVTGAGDQGSELVFLKKEFYSANSIGSGGKHQVRLRDGSTYDVAETPSQVLAKVVGA